MSFFSGIKKDAIAVLQSLLNTLSMKHNILSVCTEELADKLNGKLFS
jgi:hypothetical protein